MVTKSQTVFSEVNNLYSAATTSMGKWMWRNHTQWVAEKATLLAEKYGADTEKVYCAALLHDVGDCHYERNHEHFESWSKEKSEEILRKAGFSVTEIAEILEAIRTHSCRPGSLPTTQEGKVLATADGMWHIQTNFFPVICYMNRPQTTTTFEEWQDWFNNKIERDFGPKVFFKDEKTELEEDYHALKRIFGKRALDTELD